MNFIQKCKNNAGFTLVELIVVIAILAILAGVAVPAYTGYIAKAEEAADQQLLGAVNTAFQAACLEEGVDSKDVKNAKISLKDATSGEGKSVDAITQVTGLNAEDINNAFQRYFAGNADASFKVITRLMFADGVFVEAVMTDGQQAVMDYLEETYGGEGGKIEQWLGSTFNNMGSEELLGQVDWVTGLASDAMVDGSVLFGIVNNGEYLTNLMNSLNMGEEEFTALITEKTENGTLSQFMANSLVLSVAQNSASNPALNKDTVASQLADGSIKNAISGNLADSGDPETALAQAALAYGMYTSYANYIGDQNMINNAANMEGLDQLTVMLNDMYGKESDGVTPTFAEYMKGQGASDLSGYLAALEMVGKGAAQDSSVTLDVLNNGFMGLDSMLGSLGK